MAEQGVVERLGEDRTSALFSWVRSGELVVHVGGTFSLAEGHRAHEALEGRATTGKLVLIP